MFAIFLTDAMDPFYRNIATFPTVIFTVLLLLCVFYWLLAVIGVVDLDFLDLDLPDGDVDVTEAGSSVGLLGGLLLRLGLYGVPMPIVISLLSLFGWFICYYAILLLPEFLTTGLLGFLVGIPVLLVSFYLASVISALIIKPLRPIFKAADQEVEKRIVGQVAIVRTSRVDSSFGEASVEDGGAGLIVKIRPYKDDIFTRGDRVILLEYLHDQNIYKVISESEFNNDFKI